MPAHCANNQLQCPLHPTKNNQILPKGQADLFPVYASCYLTEHSQKALPRKIMGLPTSARSVLFFQALVPFVCQTHLSGLAIRLETSASSSDGHSSEFPKSYEWTWNKTYCGWFPLDGLIPLGCPQRINKKRQGMNFLWIPNIPKTKWIQVQILRNSIIIQTNNKRDPSHSNSQQDFGVKGMALDKVLLIKK